MDIHDWMIDIHNWIFDILIWIVIMDIPIRPASQ